MATKEEVMEICNEAIELRELLKQVSFCAEALKEETDLSVIRNVVEDIFRLSRYLPDGPARIKAAVMKVNWKELERQKQKTQRRKLRESLPTEF